MPTAVALGAVLATLGCQEKTVEEPVLTGIRVLPAAISVTIAESKPVSVTAIYSDSSVEPLLPEQVTFSTSNGAVVQVNASGVVSGVATGAARITAEYSGLTASIGADVTPRCVGLRVVPAVADVSVGVPRAMRAIALYEDHTSKDVSEAAVWAPHSPSTAMMDGNLVTGVVAGQTRVYAIYDGRAASATVGVTQRSLSGIAISGGPVSLAQGTSARLGATASFGDSTTLDVARLADWTTSDEEVATVSAGVVSAVGAGTATIKATFALVGGTPVEATTQVTVKAGTVVIQSIAVTATPATIPLDTEAKLKAIATLSDGNSQDVTYDVAWSVENPVATDTGYHAAILGTVATTVKTPTSATFTEGTTDVVAKIISGGAVIKGSAPLTVTKGTESIAVPSGTSIAIGDTIVLSAIASFTDPAGFTFDVTDRIVWWVTDGSLENDTVLVVGDEGHAIAIGAGTATIAAWYRGTKVGELTVSVHP